MSTSNNSQTCEVWSFPVEEVVNRKDLLWGYVDAIIKSDLCSVSSEELKDFCYAICGVDELEGTNIQSLGINKFYYSNKSYLNSLSDTDVLDLSNLESQQPGYPELPKLQLARVIADALTLALQRDSILGECWYCCESTKVVSKALFGTSHRVLECPTDLVSDNAELGTVLSRLREIRGIFKEDITEQSNSERNYANIFGELARFERLLFNFTSEDKRSIMLNKLSFTHTDLQDALYRYIPKMEIPASIVEGLGKDVNNFMSKYFVAQVGNDDSWLTEKKLSDYVTLCHNGFFQVLVELVERGYRQHGGAVSASVVLLSKKGNFPFKYKIEKEAGVLYPQADVSTAVRNLVSKLFIESDSGAKLDDLIEAVLFVYANILCRDKPSMDDIKEMCR